MAVESARPVTRRDADEFARQELWTRRRIARWLAVSPPSGESAGRPADSPGGLAVPAAEASAVIAAARRLALRGLPEKWVPPPPPRELLLVAEVLVVDEHPSAPDWTAAERGQAVRWVAVLVGRFGEDGVQSLVRVLAAEA
ncbi:hypothetical protein ACIGXM_30080 [Kitasatospora sp. NPDC052896]|uniref:hypothetical protein n=1 Tax=Kitasatospora sp. NPDC052896 TaxID=3364061 RepID=UPI0037CAEB7C